MELDRLSIFLDVYRANGFAPVARARNIAPSTVSRAISSLEESLGVLLFTRTTRSLSPTEAGIAFRARISPLVEELEAASADARDQISGVRGRLRITASVSYGHAVLAPRLKSFRRLYPHLGLDLILSDNVIDLVSERIDVAIRLGALEDSALVAMKLQDMTYRLAASPEYLADRPAIRSPEDILDHALISFSYEAFRTFWTFKRDGEKIDLPIEPALTVTNASTIAECTRQGMGLGILADWMCQDDLATGRLVEVFPHWQVSGRTPESSIWLVYPTRKYLPAKVSHFRDWLVDQYRPRLEKSEVTPG